MGLILAKIELFPEVDISACHISGHYFYVFALECPPPPKKKKKKNKKQTKKKKQQQNNQLFIQFAWPPEGRNWDT